MAAAEWAQAVREVAPLRTQLQQMLPAARRERLPWLRRVASREADRATLAPAAEQMDADELRLCQVWMYGLATRLADCRHTAAALASAVGMADPNAPLGGYDARRWHPRSAAWREMEACVHVQAGRAGTAADAAWRRPAERAH